MNGASVESQAYVGVVPDTNDRNMAAGDYNGDRKADILWRHISGGRPVGVADERAGEGR